MKRFIEWLDEEKYKYGGRTYSDSKLARDTGINKNTISAWMNEKKKPDRDNIHKLAIHFLTPSRYIYDLLGETPPDGLNDEEELLMGLIKRIPDEAKQSGELKAVLGKWGTLSDAIRQEIMQLSQRGGDAGQVTDKPLGKPSRKHSS